MSPREASSTPSERTASEAPAWSNWLAAAIAVAGIALVVKTSPRSQGEWNDLYRRKG